MCFSTMVSHARQLPKQVLHAVQDLRLPSGGLDDALLTSSDCVQIFDRDGRPLWMNACGWRMSAVSDTTPRSGTSWLSFWSSRYRGDAETALDSALNGEEARFTAQWAGTATWWDVVVRPFSARPGAPPHLIAISRDVTSYVTLSEQRWELLNREREARVEADSVNRRKNYALLAAAHELGSPMYAVRGWAELLQTKDSDPDEQREAIDAIGRNTDRLYRLVDQLLEVARFQSGRASLNLLANSLRDIVNDALQSINATARSKNIAMHAELECEAWILADFDQLQRAVSNVLFNAIKFTRENGTVWVRCVLQEDSAEIVVTDTGAGLAAAHLSEIFEPYRRYRSDAVSANTGLGIGLSIVRAIIEAHKGTIRASSPGPGLGATFTITLPLTAVAPSTHPGRESIQ